MFKNYFKIALRNLWKNKGYSAINIFGLAIGLATCLLITLYVTDELGYDKFFKNSDRIYRINSDLRFGGSELHISESSDMMGQLLKKDYPQVESFTRIYNNEGGKLVKKGNEYINEKQIAYVDSNFFEIFSLTVVEGNTATALNEPNTIVLTKTAAKKYFPEGSAISKTLEIKAGEDVSLYKVTAIVEDIPKESHMNLQFFLSMKNANYQWGQVSSHNFHTYLLLQPGTDYKAFEKKFDDYIDKYVLTYVKQFIKIKDMDEFRKSGNRLTYSLIPLTDIHLHSDYMFEITPSGNIQYVYIFSAVALFILLLACINFMNLSTARSAKRAKEVGVRKVLGTERKTLISQFLVESTLTAIIAFVIALMIAWLVLPLFNDIAAKELSIKNLLGWKLLPLLIVLPFFVGILAGSYPALYLSGFKPIVVLKGNAALGLKKSNLRSVLVVFQFATSIILIIGTMVVYSQLDYIQNRKMGYGKEQVLIIDQADALNNKQQTFKNEILAMPGVRSGTVSSYLPVSNSSRSDNSFSKEAIMDANSGIDMQCWRVDYDYIPTMGMEIKEGRNFSKQFGADSNALLITETAARLLNFKDAVGKSLYAPLGESADNKLVPMQIIGVVKDFHYESLHQKLGPLCMKLGSRADIISFKISTQNPENLISGIERKWKTMAPGMPFSYRFMSDSFNQMYRSETRAGNLAIVFSVLAIFIACLGLFGLATYMAEQRTKEIGIRKVLGASVGNVVKMLSKDFLILVSISAVLAFPVAWWAMHNWLDDFEYRTKINGWIFLIAGLVAIIIANATVSFQAIRAAVSNPVKSLRTE